MGRGGVIKRVSIVERVTFGVALPVAPGESASSNLCSRFLQRISLSARCGRRGRPMASAAARRAARCLTEVLPADALGLVLYQLTLAHDIAAVAPTCHALDDAAKIALKLLM